MLVRPRSRRARAKVLWAAVASGFLVFLVAMLPAAGSASAQRGVTPKPDALALEPIGGYTKLGDVRIITTELCPAQSEVIIARISGAGFKPDSNVFGNTELALVPKMPDGSGYVAPIYADWDYLATAHGAKTPLEGMATLTFLCADKDLERIDAQLEGSVRFESKPGEPTRYLQDGGPRVASGLPGVPAPGAGGVPQDAPTAAPVSVSSAGSATGSVSSGSDIKSDVPGASSDDNAASSGATAQSTDNRLTASDRTDSGLPIVPITFGGVALLLLASAVYFFVRRPPSDGYSGHEG